MAAQQVKEHTQETLDRATELYFAIEKHFAMGGSALSFRDLGKMIGLTSSGSCQAYLNILVKWELVSHPPGSVRTIVLAKRNYPPVVYGTPTDHSEPLYLPLR